MENMICCIKDSLSNLSLEGKDRIIVGNFGADDFLADMQIERKYNKKNDELDLFRREFAIKCTAHKLISLDTPYCDYNDSEGLKDEIKYLKGIGIKAKCAIHPSQVDIINKAFRPTEQQIMVAKEIISKFEKAMKDGKTIITHEGRMYGPPAYKRMMHVLYKADLA